MAELNGRIALVTGSSRGIGRAVAIGLARAGADVAVNFRENEKEALSTLEQVTSSSLGEGSSQVASPPGPWVTVLVLRLGSPAMFLKT